MARTLEVAARMEFAGAIGSMWTDCGFCVGCVMHERVWLWQDASVLGSDCFARVDLQAGTGARILWRSALEFRYIACFFWCQSPETCPCRVQSWSLHFSVYVCSYRCPACPFSSFSPNDCFVAKCFEVIDAKSCWGYHRDYYSELFNVVHILRRGVIVRGGLKGDAGRRVRNSVPERRDGQTVSQSRAESCHVVQERSGRRDSFGGVRGGRVSVHSRGGRGAGRGGRGEESFIRRYHIIQNSIHYFVICTPSLHPADACRCKLCTTPYFLLHYPLDTMNRIFCYGRTYCYPSFVCCIPSDGFTEG